MSKISRTLFRAVLSIVITALAGFFLAVPSTAAPSTAAAVSVAAAPKPCGVKHYPPCPPKHSIHIYHHRVHRGGHVGVVAKHFRPHQLVKVTIKGHGHNRSLGRFVTNRNGNVTFRVKIPKGFKPGRYRLTVKVGSTIKTVIIRVRR